ncbi:MAG: dienelactone hydrolase family protein [Burkholderiaceae bacterium]|nr:dienelactone hydrolase family protein [Burkholderiaceae bacterium]
MNAIDRTQRSRPHAPAAEFGLAGPGRRARPRQRVDVSTWTRRARQALAATVFALAGAAASAKPTLDAEVSRLILPLAAGGAISAHWFPRDGAQRQPAIVALHGCGGLWRAGQPGAAPRFASRYVDYVARLRAAGYHVLLPDSFTARGERSICSQKNAARRVTVETRRADVAAAVRWLAAHPHVDAARIVVLGWSHGAMTTLAAINGARPDAARPVAAAVVFYPGCAALLEQDFVLAQPLLMLLGAADDWTPPMRCEQLVAGVRKLQPQADITLRVYADSYHGFDGTGPVRLRPEVPNGLDPRGAHAGGNPVARAAALAELDRFLLRTRQ